VRSIGRPPSVVKETLIFVGASLILASCGGGGESTSSGDANEESVSGLVGHYRLNGNAIDSSGNGNNGEAFNAIATTDRLGNANAAIEFDGVNTYIEIPESDSLSPIDAISMFAWVKSEGAAGPIVNYCVDCWGVHLWEVTTEAGALDGLQTRFTIRGSSRFTDRPHMEVPGVMLDGEWKFVGSTYDASTGEASLWANGEQVASINIGEIELATNHPIRVGIGGGGRSSRIFKGSIDDIRIYNKALSEQEILDLYSL